MFDKSSMMYIYVETPLHAGSGRAVGVVDLPIQRERVTGYPLVQSSGMKGRLRAEASAYGIGPNEVNAIFGPDKVTSDDSAYAGALSVGDARILLFPVRSLYGVFAWTTSANVLARYLRDMVAARIPDDKSAFANAFKGLDSNKVYAGSAVTSDDNLVLEEFSYTAKDKPPADIVNHLKAALPAGGEYEYWMNSMAGRLVILPENDFRDFVQYATEVVTRVRLDDDTKTVARGALWTEESLPSDTLLYCPLYASKSRNGTNIDSATVLSTLENKLNTARIRLGGDETVGRGSVALRFVGGK